MDGPASPESSLRSDAAANRERILETTAGVVNERGPQVPMAVLAEAADVGVGTLYRHFSSREGLIAAVQHRAFELILRFAKEAARKEGSAVEPLRHFFDQIIVHRDDLVLPLLGGPARRDQKTRTLQRDIRSTLQEVLRRGQEQGTLRSDVAPFDIIVMGAFVAQPLPHVSDWDRVAKRQTQIYLAGLTTQNAAPLPDESPDIVD